MAGKSKPDATANILVCGIFGVRIILHLSPIAMAHMTDFQGSQSDAALDLGALARLPNAIGRPGYDVGAAQIGVVHFGPGAFFRAHQAAYFDKLLEKDKCWGLCGVSLHSSGVRDALQPQDGLYTLAILDEETRFRVIGALRESLLAPERPDAVLARLASPNTRLVTLTVTEKGYGFDETGRLDLNDRAIRHDVENLNSAPRSVIGWLVKGFRARLESGLDPFVTLSCDNLSDNGGKLGRAVVSLTRAIGDRRLADWIEARARFPNTMVDSITPATDDALRTRVAHAIGVKDAWPVQREAFSQWVIEDTVGTDAPALAADLASVGATITNNVRLFEQAKLRLLNGAHSSLAYIGHLAGLRTVAEAMKDQHISGFIVKLMRADIAPSLQSGSGLDLATYVSAILARFRNPALRHELAQIACDGSKKIAVRLLPTISDALAAGRPLGALAVPVAAWMLFVRRQIESGSPLVDPLGSALQLCVGGAVEDDVPRFLDLAQVFPLPVAQAAAFRAAVQTAHLTLRTDFQKALF